MNWYIFIAAALMNLAACNAGSSELAQTKTQEFKQPQCTSSPCGNTASGKDPQEERIQEGERKERAIRTAGDDRERWSIPIYSTSTAPEDLSLEVIRKTHMTMRLTPEKGHLTFSSNGVTHVFAIARPQGEGGVCPAYNLTVVDASEVHVLLKRVCRKSEYKPNKFSRSVAYYLYDSPTATMRDIWVASATGKDDPLPDARPSPIIERVSNGYEFKWSGVYPSQGDGTLVRIHNRYVRKLEGRNSTLVCKNVLDKNQSNDGAACEGEFLPRLSSNEK